MLRSTVAPLRAAAPVRAARAVPVPSRPISTSAPRNAHVSRVVSSRPINTAIVLPRRSVQQAQQKERVVDTKIGEVKPKSSHQANREDRQRMHCTHDEAKKRISLRCNPQHPVVAVIDYEIVRPGVWDLKYTQVSPEFQHHSVADEIVARTMAFAEANKCVSPIECIDR